MKDVDLNALHIERLSSGATVVLLPCAGLSVSASLRFSVGATREQGRRGFAHFAEHLYASLLVQGETSLPVALARCGAIHVNAVTEYDGVSHFWTLPSDALPFALALEGRRLELAATADEKILRPLVEREQRVILSEIADARDEDSARELDSALDSCFDGAEGSSGYFGSLLGREEDVREASVEDLASFLASSYRAENATLALVGNFDVRAVLEMLGKTPLGRPQRSGLPRSSQGVDAPSPESKETGSFRTGPGWRAWATRGFRSESAVGFGLLVEALDKRLVAMRSGTGACARLHWKAGADAGLLVLTSAGFSDAAQVLQSLSLSVHEDEFTAAKESAYCGEVYTRLQRGGLSGLAQRLARGHALQGDPLADVDPVLLHDRFMKADLDSARHALCEVLGTTVKPARNEIRSARPRSEEKTPLATPKFPMAVLTSREPLLLEGAFVLERQQSERRSDFLRRVAHLARFIRLRLRLPPRMVFARRKAIVEITLPVGREPDLLAHAAAAWHEGALFLLALAKAEAPACQARSLGTLVEAKAQEPKLPTWHDRVSLLLEPSLESPLLSRLRESLGVYDYTVRCGALGWRIEEPRASDSTASDRVEESQRILADVVAALEECSDETEHLQEARDLHGMAREKWTLLAEHAQSTPHLALRAWAVRCGFAGA